MTLFGIDRLLAEPELRRPLEGKRVAILAHPASVTRDLTHSVDALAASGLKLTAAFGPQHGLRGDKQDNMVESDDFTDPVHQIPVFSLYGEVRRPTGQSMGTLAAASTPSSPRFSTCSKPPQNMARPCGCWTDRTQRDARSKA